MPARSPLIFLPKARVFDATRKLEPELFPNETRSFHLSRVWVRLPLSQGKALVESRGSKRKPDQILFATSLRNTMTDLQAGGQFVCPSVLHQSNQDWNCIEAAARAYCHIHLCQAAKRETVLLRKMAILQLADYREISPSLIRVSYAM